MSKQKTAPPLEFNRSKQFDLDYFAPTEDKIKSNTQIQYEQLEAYYKEKKEKAKNKVSNDPEVLKIAQEFGQDTALAEQAEPKKKFQTPNERGRKDSVRELFQTPKTRMDDSQNNSTYVPHKTDPPEKLFNMRRDRDSEFFECLC